MADNFLHTPPQLRHRAAIADFIVSLYKQHLFNMRPDHTNAGEGPQVPTPPPSMSPDLHAECDGIAKTLAAAALNKCE